MYEKLFSDQLILSIEENEKDTNINDWLKGQKPIE